MSKFDEFADFQPENRAAWRAWLAENHDKATGVWLVYYKKVANKPRVTYDEAVEEALCFGWIDSLPRKLDAARSKLLFTPRKSGSGWSKLNKQRIEKLFESSSMTEFGQAKIEAAKRDGSWEKLDKSENLEMPADLAQALNADETAKHNFDAFTPSVRKNIYAWIENAKREETRQMRINKTVELAARNKRAIYDKD